MFRSLAVFIALAAAVSTVGPTSAADSGRPAASAPSSVQSQAVPNDLDAFMARVLERRDEGWRKLHDYILSEREEFALTGPAGVRLSGARREYSWYVRDGFLIRSPVRFNGVAIGDDERRRYEEKWLEEEKARDEKRAKGGRKQVTVDLGKGEVKVEPRKEAGEPAAGQQPAAQGDPQALDGLVTERGEPRFISESFFLRFKFEPGNYYFAGREQIEGRQVVRIEYYPTRLFGENEGERAKRPERRPRNDRDADVEQRIERDLNKVALVTLWIDPAEYQIVRYKFDNVDFGFLPARWLFRLDTVTASMTMARVLDGVWLPRQIEMRAAVTLASGGYGFQYGREFHDYKKAETSARIRSYGTEDQ